MQSQQVFTHLDSDPRTLAPGRTRFLFAAYIDRSPIDTEKVEYRIGPSKCGKFDALWLMSDFDDYASRTAAAWTPRHQMKGKALQLALLEGLFAAEKTHLELDEPNFSELAPTRGSLLSAREIGQAATAVFGVRA
jgi:hypothetical protein